MYLDPGSGSVILQVLIAGLLAMGVFFRVFWQKLKAYFGKGKSETLAAEDEQKEA